MALAIGSWIRTTSSSPASRPARVVAWFWGSSNSAGVEITAARGVKPAASRTSASSDAITAADSSSGSSAAPAASNGSRSAVPISRFHSPRVFAGIAVQRPLRPPADRPPAAGVDADHRRRQRLAGGVGDDRDRVAVEQRDRRVAGAEVDADVDARTHVTSGRGGGEVQSGRKAACSSVDNRCGRRFRADL